MADVVDAIATPLEPRPRPTRQQIKRWRRHLAEERTEAQTYRNLAAREEGEIREFMLELADAEKRHEKHWLTLLGEHAEPAPRPRLYSRMLAGLAGRFGSVFTLALVQRSEQRSDYETDADATEQMVADERIHGEVVRTIATASRNKIAGNFRAAIFGANDGLVSNLALILGVAGAGMGNGWVLTTGIAGLLAGSLSMAAGEWISVSSARELIQASTPEPLNPRSVKQLDVQENELVLLFRARGETSEEAHAHARAIFESVGPPGEDTGTVALELIAPQGVAAKDDSAENLGRPFQVALASFFFFAIGAVIPLVPYVFGMSGYAAILVSLAIVGVALLMTGGLVGIMSGRAPWLGALRQLAIGLTAAGITFALGNLFGTVA